MPPRVASIAADALARAADPAQVRQLRLVLRLLESRAREPAAHRPARRRSATGRRRRASASSSAGPARRCRSVGRRSTAFRKLLTFLAYADPGSPRGAESAATLRSATDPSARRSRRTWPPIRPLDVTPSGAGRRPDEPVTLEADVVVVGSGAGGGVVAAELARAGRRVVVVEAGPFVDEATMPRDELDAYGRLYLNHGLLSTWDGAVTMLAGRGRRRRHARELDDVASPRPRMSGPSGRATTASTGSTDADWADDVADDRARARGRRPHGRSRPRTR